tara:strand:+ start:16874 stop:17716 length:843 start_codon:yes stop_codon:yes gene_type:complete
VEHCSLVSPADPTLELEKIASLKDNEISLGDTALLLAVLDEPLISIQRYKTHMSKLSVDVEKAYTSNNTNTKLEALREVIANEYGYVGDTDTYDSLQNANLIRVIDRRKGLPIALGILYMHSARMLGWSIEGLKFPGHFLLRIEDESERVIFDPFDSARRIEVFEMRALLKKTLGSNAELSTDNYEIASNREILIRLQNNKKIRLLKTQQVSEALSVVESMISFAPNLSGLWHEAGVLNNHLGKISEAILSLEQCYELCCLPQEKARLEELISGLHNRLN